MSLGFRRRRPVNLESSCSEGAQDSCELGRTSPEPREGSEPRRRLQVGPAARGDRGRLRCPSSPPPPERRCPWDIHPPTCSGKFPPEGSSRATETRELPIRLPGRERRYRTGPRGAPTARRKSGVLTVCQLFGILKRAKALNRRVHKGTRVVLWHQLRQSLWVIHIRSRSTCWSCCHGLGAQHARVHLVLSCHHVLGGQGLQT
ncbi:uncharacterized protein LOC104005573 [Pan troglodytes]|uniref:uncharacterized protein LOC104005573 n=1 Tax=Pan troglodytes TaxID=9598 RepID=UPI0007DBC1FA|nr:uncharacterized protein LOC104005573 [Pan troglodytes]